MKSVLSKQLHHKTDRVTADQLLIEVLHILQRQHLHSIPVFEYHLFIGFISMADITAFFSNKAGKIVLYHKFNYTVASLLFLQKAAKDL